MKVAVMCDTTHNPFDEARWVSCLRENLTSSSYGEGLETGRAVTQVPRQSLTRQLDLCSIKAVMQMDILRCRSPERVCKEIAVHLAAYNLVRTVMAQVAYLGQVLPRELSFEAALQLLRAFEQNLRHCPCGQLASQRAVLLAGIAQLSLPHPPGRGRTESSQTTTQATPTAHSR